MRIHRGNLIGKDATFFETYTNELKTVQTSNLTLKELKAFLAQEKTRLFNKGTNIMYYICTNKDMTLKVTHKQFMEVAQKYHTNGVDEGYLIPNYDDGNDGVAIYVNQCQEKKKKTKIYIDC